MSEQITLRTMEAWNEVMARSTPVILKANEVHVYSLWLDAPLARIAALGTLLDKEEQARADRFRFSKDRNRFILAHGWLRLLLGQYLQMDPHLLSFTYSQYGKPALENAPREIDLRFNLSHAGNLALLAITLGRAIGADIEHIRADFPGMDVAEHFFSAQEFATLQTLSADQQTLAFFNCWTRKEAYIKALGEGLSHPLHTFDVSLAPGESPQLAATRPDPAEAARWSLAAFSPHAEYVAAVAAQGNDWHLRYFPMLTAPLV